MVDSRRFSDNCLLFVFIAMAAVPTIKSVNWCTKNLRCGNYQNTMCIYREEKSKQYCSEIKKNMNPSTRMSLLMLHNSLRQNVSMGVFKPSDESEPWPKAGNMRQITWDYELEKVAVRWAMQCEWGKDKCRKTPVYESVGQNVWSNWSSIQYPKHKEAFDYFSNQVKYLTKFPEKYEQDDKAHPYGMFTQLIWANTYKMGCGFVRYKKSGGAQLYSGIACNYAPSGNAEGEELYERLPENHPPPPAAKKCPQLTIIRDPKITIYPDLCALPSDPPIDIPVPDPSDASLFRPNVLWLVSTTIALYVSLIVPL